MADPVRVGVVGVGWGAVAHAPAFGAVDDYQLVAMCGRDPERLARAATAAGVDDASTDWRSFVRRDDLDLISVATPVAAHHEIGLAAIEAGKAVLIEKPLALNPGQAEDLVSAARRNGTIAATCFENRWTPDRYAVWQAIRDGYLGDPYVIRVQQTGGYWHPSRRPQSPWMYRVAEGGGYLAGMISHDLDFVCTLLGDPVQVCAEVHTTVTRRPAPGGGQIEVDADDTSTVMLRWASGAVGTLTSTVVALFATEYSYEAFGSEGSLQGVTTSDGVRVLGGRLRDDRLRELPVSGREVRSGRPLPQRKATPQIKAMALMLEDWAPAFSGTTTLVPSFSDGLRVERIILAARQSSAGAGWVDLGLEGTHR